MVFKRTGRPGHYFQARTATGFKPLRAARSRSLALRIESMWERLAVDYRAWDILDRVLGGSLKIERLYDLWDATNHDVAEMRRRFHDVDVSDLVDQWYAIYSRGVNPDSAQHALVHVRSLLPEGSKVLASAVSTAWLTAQLGSYPGKRNTLRKVHSSWSVFFDYCTRIAQAFPRNPMELVDRPKVEESPIRFYELDQVDRIVDAQPNPERRAVMALLYGSGIEVSVALGLTAGDLNRSTREIRAAGTKAHSRDRVCRLADWAWMIIEEYTRNFLPTGRLWTFTRWAVSDWHRETVADLGLPVYPLHNARDHWAVQMLRAGTPVAVVQAQLGHGSPTLTLRKYGRFLPSASDRDHWQAEASKFEAKRRKNNEA